MALPKAFPDSDDQRAVRTLERDRYLALLHLYNVGGSTEGGSLTAERITRDLAFPDARGDLIIRSLVSGGLVLQSTSGGGLVLSPAGVRYIERDARRRRSVRLLR